MQVDRIGSSYRSSLNLPTHNIGRPSCVERRTTMLVHQPVMSAFTGI
jgi:hypothetical protein